ncbi:30S ribosomal protein S2 chloroplastic [Bienertia sinuspersici]
MTRYWNINLEEMMEAEVHFGHGTRKSNPRMLPYISAKCKGSHILNLVETARQEKKADSVTRVAIRSCCHYVNKKWLGGMLMNFPRQKRDFIIRDLRMEQKAGRLTLLPKRDAAVLKSNYLTCEDIWKNIRPLENVLLWVLTICLVDTIYDPNIVDILIRENDDGVSNSIARLLGSAALAVRSPQTIPTSVTTQRVSRIIKTDNLEYYSILKELRGKAIEQLEKPGLP